MTKREREFQEYINSNSFKNEKRKIQQEKNLLMKLEMLKTQALIIIQSASPYRSGDLSRSFQIRLVEDGFEIYQDTSSVDYMVYTEEA
ncbi:hypothetical protein, partial [Sulfuricurvum sp. MLSB]|uniref:hypothetical protein n=1 Tax=Sulfuricurvum sp. MLSB TaxID=1537917 RepID=UPI0025CDB8FA